MVRIKYKGFTKRILAKRVPLINLFSVGFYTSTDMDFCTVIIFESPCLFCFDQSVEGIELQRSWVVPV